jgi:hypothetical protein
VENIGKAVVALGVVLVVAGLLVWFLGDKLTWFGRLPGDIRIERPGFSCFFPITTMIIVSVILSIVLSLLSRFLNR